jgi:hypothetical protein
MMNFGATADEPSNGNYRFKSQFGAKIVRRYVVRHVVLPAQIDNFARAILGKRFS